MYSWDQESLGCYIVSNFNQFFGRSVLNLLSSFNNKLIKDNIKSLKVKITHAIVYAVRSNDLRLQGHTQMLNFSLIEKCLQLNLGLTQPYTPSNVLLPTMLKLGMNKINESLRL